ncbi:MAG: hypothetical protein NUK63_06025 [Candidatus Bathyarchaeum tardum]|nr:MAG: hypothetical protein NUK63_06025 [Candidatus Bathyarchaeum tardum]
MTNSRKRLFLVGDNAFHGISHLSQDNARSRGNSINSPEFAADLVMTSLENEANGFMFSVSETTLTILKIIHEKDPESRPELYALVPYAFEYVRQATQIGISGLAKNFTKQIARSGNIGATAMGLKGVLRMDPVTLLKTYVLYEISRIKSAAGKQANIASIVLHELITDIGLALSLDWLFKSFIEFMVNQGIKPGFNTRNFAYLVKKFDEWNINFNDVIIAAPFNKVGFQMDPSKDECERALASVDNGNVIAISILAAGYLAPLDAIEYVQSLPNILGVAVGVSKEKHAFETFNFFKKNLTQNRFF